MPQEPLLIRAAPVGPDLLPLPVYSLWLYCQRPRCMRQGDGFHPLALLKRPFGRSNTILDGVAVTAILAADSARLVAPVGGACAAASRTLPAVARTPRWKTTPHPRASSPCPQRRCTSCLRWRRPTVTATRSCRTSRRVRTVRADSDEVVQQFRRKPSGSSGGRRPRDPAHAVHPRSEATPGDAHAWGAGVDDAGAPFRHMEAPFSPPPRDAGPWTTKREHGRLRVEVRQRGRSFRGAPEPVVQSGPEPSRAPLPVARERVVQSSFCRGLSAGLHSPPPTEVAMEVHSDRAPHGRRAPPAEAGWR